MAEKFMANKRNAHSNIMRALLSAPMLGLASVILLAVFVYFPGVDISVESNDILDSFFPMQASAPDVWDSLLRGDAWANSSIGLSLNQSAMTEFDVNRIIFSMLGSYAELSWFYFVGLVMLYISAYLALSAVSGQILPKWGYVQPAKAAFAIGALLMALFPHSAPVVGSIIALNLFVAATAWSFGTGRTQGILLLGLASALFDDAALGGIYYKPAFLVVSVVYGSLTRKWRPFACASALFLFMLLCDYRTFVGVLNGPPSQRSTWQLGASSAMRLSPEDWTAAFGMAKTMLFGVPDHYHYQWNTKHSTFILWAGACALSSVVLLFVTRARRAELAPRFAVWTGISSAMMLLVLLVSLLYAIFRLPIVPLAVWLHQPVQIERAFALILPLVAAFVGTFALSPLIDLVRDKRAQNGLVIIAAFLLVNWIHTPFNRKMENVAFHQKAGSDNPFIPNYTAGTYYQRGVYRALKAKLGPNWSAEHVITIGGDPMVAAYNGFSNLDGYYPQYPKAWQKAFREIAKPALDRMPEQRALYDGWGNRFNVPVAGNVDGKLDAPINGCAMDRLGGTLILSYAPLLDPGSSGLVESGSVTGKTDGLEGSLYMYRINPDACAKPLK